MIEGCTSNLLRIQHDEFVCKQMPVKEERPLTYQA